MINIDDLKYAHKPECKNKNSNNIIHKNVYFDEIGEVEYDAYCDECGAFLYYFCYGHDES